MAERISVSDLLYRACTGAEQWEEEWLTANEHCTDEATLEAVKDTRAFLKQLTEYRKKRWGKTGLEKYSEGCELVKVTDLLKRQAPQAPAE